MKKLKTVLTIAGSDSSGGAGIQADIKTIQANGAYAMSAIAALTAQNTTGVRSIMEVPATFLGEQLDAVFEDIFPDAVKIGMVSSQDLIQEIAKKLRQYEARNVVVDPVMVSTSGSMLLKESAIETLKSELFVLASVLTPNIPEAEWLTGEKITTKEEQAGAAKIISEEYGCAVLCKGGHRIEGADDLLYMEGKEIWFTGERINNPNTHGTGCTLSSAIAANLAKGWDLEEAIRRAKAYVAEAIGAMLDLGAGAGPIDHGFERERKTICFNISSSMND